MASAKVRGKRNPTPQANAGALSPRSLLVGCAGWNLGPERGAESLAIEGSQLARYAAKLPATEINSSFRRSHRPSTYARWAASVPRSFRFSVKMPKAITHEARLCGAENAITTFMGEVGELGERLGCLLVQLPPSLAFDPAVGEGFFDTLRRAHAGGVALEPRHDTWFSSDAEAMLRALHIARVAADPPRSSTGAEPGGWPGLAYYRLHGSPRMYYSSYDAGYLGGLAERLRALVRQADSPRDHWCIFDNTAGGAAAPNALGLMDRLTTTQ